MKRLSAPGYDLFKTIVTVLLAVILLVMLLRGCATNPSSPAPTETAAAQSLTEAPASALPAVQATQTFTPSPAPTTAEPAIAAPTTTPTPAAVTATEPPTAAPDQATATPQAQNVSCNTSAPSRLSVGQKARVVQRLNMRKEASIQAAILRTNAIGTQVDIIGGPVCTPVGDHAYLWWQIRLANGGEGWSAELPLNAATYFLEPIS